VGPVLAQAYAAEAEWLLTIDELPEAQELVDKAMAIDPSLPTVHAVRAAIALVLGQREEALASFTRADELDPTDLWAYQGFELVRRGFHAQRRDRDGARALETLQGDLPGTIYPGLNLAYVYQEYLSAEDPRAFEQAHRVIQGLLRRHPYPFLQAFEVETLVTTGRYDEAVAEAGRLVREGNLGPDTVFNLHLLAFTSQVLAGDLGAAEKELSRLETAYLTLPEDFSNPWSFAGLERYVQGQGLPKGLEGILLSLPARTRERRTAEEDKSLFQNIRSTLEDLQQSA
jgi:tetratricopeptide (TPR) repeat protein